MLPTPNRQLLAIGLLCAALGGCEATGDVGGDRTISDDGVPFSFEVPTEFTKATIDDANSRGDVLVAAGISKVDVIAVRRVGGLVVTSGGVRQKILGHDVTSELHPVAGAPGYVIECQYTSERRAKVLAACRDALRTVKRK